MEPDIQAYTEVMEEIRRRTEVVSALFSGRATVMYKVTQVESMVLQVRMIAELIAFASLAANRQVFEENQRNFKKTWDLAKLMKDIQKLNPGFYPKPVLEVPSKTPGVKNDLVDVTSGFMGRDELVEVHGRCGGLLHARNPYGDPIRCEDFELLIPTWMEKIKKLLNCHVVQLLGNTRLYIVHMKESHDDRVHVHTFERVMPKHAVAAVRVAAVRSCRIVAPARRRPCC